MSTERNTLKGLGSRVRERRLAAGISQAGAARAAGVGRSTLIHFEQGRKDIRLSNALAIADAVGTSLGIESANSPQVDRFRARAEHQAKLGRRRERHLALAVDLAMGRSAALKALRDARSMVKLWQRDHTCSEYYIREWSRILSGSPSRVAGRMREIPEGWRDAMFQNTPFSMALANG